jgi:hypothetical protein
VALFRTGVRTEVLAMAENRENEDQAVPSEELKYVVSGPSPYTVEAEIEMIGRFAAGARRQRGWRGVVARSLALGLLAIILGSMIVGTMDLLSG